MLRRLTVFGLIALAAACRDSPIVLGSGMTRIGSRDPSNKLIACTGPACPSGSLPLDAFIVPQHYAYAAPIPGTTYIAQVFNGTIAAAPGYACCSTATFENAFTLPPTAKSATITISFYADNQAIGVINGVEIGRQRINGDNFAGPTPQTFTLNFTPAVGGTNLLHVTLIDGGGALGLDYKATVTYSNVSE